MTPHNHPQFNKTFIAPPDLDESQVQPIKAHFTHVEGGNMDGIPIVVVAWQPSEQELHDICHGAPIYVSWVGTGLVPHYLSTSFENSIKPS